MRAGLPSSEFKNSPQQQRGARPAAAAWSQIFGALPIVFQPLSTRAASANEKHNVAENGTASVAL
jgi:hypothetical protein